MNVHIIANLFYLFLDLVAMLMDPISFANRALQDMAEGLVRMCVCVHMW